MIDLHSHLLPGVDDGARTPEQALDVLRRFREDGVRTVVCTPHLRASAAARAPAAEYADRLAALRAQLGDAPELRLGWEIMLDEPGVDLAAPALGLGGSRAVLVEFDRGGIPPRAARELGRIRASGVRPVLAHPERYWGCSVTHVREWRAAGCVIQTDTAYLLGSGPRARLAQALLAEGLVDCLASDNHGDARSLATARRWLDEQGADVAADVLTRANPAAILADAPLTAVPPVIVERGVLARLRELFMGR